MFSCFILAGAASFSLDTQEHCCSGDSQCTEPRMAHYKDNDSHSTLFLMIEANEYFMYTLILNNFGEVHAYLFVPRCAVNQRSYHRVDPRPVRYIYPRVHSCPNKCGALVRAFGGFDVIL